MTHDQATARASDQGHSSDGRCVGPLETADFPDRLRARVVTPGEQPRVHGYDLEDDLARHYDVASLLLLCLSGELPSPVSARAAQTALMFTAGVSVAHASVHAAVLARLSGSVPSSVFGVAAIGLAEQSCFELDQCTDLLAWLENPERPYPEQHRCQTAAQRAAAERLHEALPSDYEAPILAQAPTQSALVISVLYGAGLRRREQLEAALAWARLPSALAEAFAERSTNFVEYPINLPRIEYHAPASER